MTAAQFACESCKFALATPRRGWQSSKVDRLWHYNRYVVVAVIAAAIAAKPWTMPIVKSGNSEVWAVFFGCKDNNEMSLMCSQDATDVNCRTQRPIWAYTKSDGRVEMYRGVPGRDPRCRDSRHLYTFANMEEIWPNLYDFHGPKSDEVPEW